MNNNIPFLIQSIKNPQQFLQNAMQNSQLMQNPMAKNTIEMMQRGDNKGLEEMGRNLCKERGLNPDEVLKQFKSQFGM